MKKVLLPLIAAALSFSASAAIPSTFNFQGVTKEKNAAIEVSFQINDAESYTVYQEDQNVITTENGSFTAVIGEGTPTRGAWDAIDWTASDYTLVTFINGGKVSEAPFQAVPYANVAGTVVGLAETQQDVIDLTEGLASLRGKVADYDLVKENLEGLVPVIETLVEGVEANTEAIAIVSDDLQGVVESMRGKANVEDVVALQEGLEITQQDVIDLTEGLASVRGQVADYDLVKENLEGLVPVIETLVEGVDANTEAIAIVSDDLQGVVESMRGKANVEDVVALQEGLEVTQQDVIDLTEGLASLRGMLAGYDNIVENLEMLVPVVETLVEGVDANTEAIAIVSSDLQGVVESLRGKANADDLIALEESYEQYTKDLEETLMESFNETYNMISANTEAIEIVSSDLQGVVESLRGYAKVDDVNAALDTLRRMIEDNAKAISELGAVH